MKTFSLQCLAGSEPGEVRVTTINVAVIDGRLQTGFFLGHQTIEGDEVALIAPERIRGWGRIDDHGKSYCVRSL